MSETLTHETLTRDPITQAEIAEAIQSATAEVFSTMLGIEITPGETASGQTAGCPQSGVVALLGLAGDWVGSGSLSCDPPFACKMASQLLMAEYDTVNDDVLDAVAEVANMIIGNVKTALEAKVGPLGMSIPTVIYGRNFETRGVGKRDWVIVPFASGSDLMNVQVSIAPNRCNHGRQPLHGFPITHSVSL
jgi:chemotaxis protein CheX